MKTSLKSLFALAAFGATASLGLAQPALKILTVDMGKVLEAYYRTQEQNEKLKGFQDRVKEEDERMLKEGRAIAEQYKDTLDQAKNPTLTAEAKAAAEGEAQKKFEELRKKEQELGNFRNEMNRSLQQSVQSTRGVLIEEVSKVAGDIAKKKGGTVLMDKNSLVYVDPGFDISDEVLAELNKGRPAASAAPATSTTPAKPADAPTGTGISFPGTKK